MLVLEKKILNDDFFEFLEDVSNIFEFLENMVKVVMFVE